MSNGMAINGLGYDPYFLQAYQYQPYAQNTNATQTVTKADAQPAVAFKGAQPEEKKKSKAGLVLGAVAVIGAAALCYKAYKTGNGAGLTEKVGDGFKTMWNSIKGKADSVIHPEKFSITGDGANAVCTIPNRTNIMRTTDATKKLAEIGETSVAEALTQDSIAKGTNVLRTFSFPEGTGTVKVVKGKIVGYFDASDTEHKVNLLKDLSETQLGNLKTRVQGFLKGENIDQLTDITFSSKANGVSKLFTTASASSEATIKAAITKKLPLDSEAVKAYCVDHPEYKEAIEKFIKGKKNGWKIVSGEYEVKDVGTLVFKNDKITGIKVDGTLYGTGTDKYKALYGDNVKAFENAIKHKKDFTNTIWQLS